MYDIIVVGGGPAGLTAALYARRAGKTVAVLEQAAVGGQIINSPLVENYPALPHVSGADLATALLEQVEALGTEILYEEAVGAARIGGGFRVDTDAGSRECRALVLALGVRHRSLGLSGEEALVGRGVSYCAVCDGAFYAARDVAVVGGGDTAVQDALFLSNTCKSVTVLVRRDRFRAAAARAEALKARDNVKILFQHTVEAFRETDGALSGLVVKNQANGETMSLSVEGVFLAVGQEPSLGAFASLAETDAGYLRAGEDTVTSAPGVFAAGDCRKKSVRQLTTAVADGAVSAIAACEYLESHG